MRNLSLLLCCGLWLGCGRTESIAADTSLPGESPAAVATRDSTESEAPEPAEPEAPRPLPTLGDPLGLLSKTEPSGQGPKAAPDPGALMRDAELEPLTRVVTERDPRAVERSKLPAPLPSKAGSEGSVRVREKLATDLLRRVRQDSPRPHVLLLHASYCKACRKAMPTFVALAKSYRGRGVSFTAASVDRDPRAFEADTPALGGILEPYWIVPDGSTSKALRDAGVVLEGDTYYIPLFAVFHQRKLVAQGNTRELRQLPQILDGLL